MNRVYTSISQIPQLVDVSRETLEQLQNAGAIRACKKGSLIYQATKRQDMLYFLMEGKAFTYTLTGEGHRKIIFILGPGAFLNESVAKNETACTYCQMMTAGKVFEIPRKTMLRLMEKDFALTCALMGIEERKIWRMSHQLKNSMGKIYMEKKLAAKLWKLARDFGEPVGESSDEVQIDLDLSVTFLADYLGAPRETTSRVCKKLSDRGLIRMEKKRITIRSMKCMALFYKNKCDDPCNNCSGK